MFETEEEAIGSAYRMRDYVETNGPGWAVEWEWVRTMNCHEQIVFELKR